MRKGLIAPALLLLLLLACGMLVMFGEIDDSVGLSSVSELWADALRDADQVGMQLTRVSEEEEMEFGRELAARMTGMREHPAWTVYVSDVGSELLPHVDRRGISYSFHAVEAPHIQAFALPGGQIYVTTGMLEFLQSEAELASVLGHEISHVDLRHCIERFQAQLAMRKVGMEELSIVADIAHSLILAGYDQSQELEADAHGLRLSLQAGYDGEVAAMVFLRLMEERGERPSTRADNVVGELAEAVEGAIGSYLESHPSSEERSRRLRAFMDRNRHRMADKPGTIGAENYEAFKNGVKSSLDVEAII
jgi:predicted Zn-dependent protease